MSKQPFTEGDLLCHRLVTDIALSPDGRQAVHEIRSVDEPMDAYETHLWVAGRGGEPPRQITHAGKSNRQPCWTPDGAIVFVSDREGTPALYVTEHGGDARRIGRDERSPGRPAISPDGRTVVFASTVELETAPDNPAARRRFASRPRVVDKLHYKVDGSGFVLQGRSQLFTMDLAEGTPSRLLSSRVNDAAAVWSPDGAHVAFVRSRSSRQESHLTDVWLVRADGTGARQLTTRAPHPSGIAWSPDGRAIAFVSAREAGQARSWVWLVSLEGDDERTITPDAIDVASFPGVRSKPLVWSTDASMFLLGVERGISRIFRVPRAGGSVTALVTGERQITSFTAAGGVIAYVWSDAVGTSSNISACRLDGTEDRLLVDVNPWIEDRRRPRLLQRTFGSGPDARHGWLLLPEEVRGARERRPLFVDVHGGPESYAELGMIYHPHWYALLARGWAVLALDAVGSSSFGAELVEALRGAWGTRDLRDHLRAVDALVAEELVDPRRVAIGGKSYGGYMAAWAIGQTPRFCAAVVCAPVANLESHFGTSDSGHYVDPYAMKSEPEDVADRFRALSPVQHAAKATTPTLILHGEDDQRCPIGQSEELFARLARKPDLDVQMVRYPGGDHHFVESGRPSHRIDYARRVVEWVERHARAAR